jgi:hypothetical protein
VLDNGAKWNYSPRECGAKSAVHKYFASWVRERFFESITRDAGELVEGRCGYKLHESFIDTTFSKARCGGGGMGDSLKHTSSVEFNPSSNSPRCSACSPSSSPST